MSEPSGSRQREERYVPALGFHWLTRFYDPLIRWGLREDAFKGRLLEQARIAPGQRVLDLGCGTATLTLRLSQSCPQARAFGLDGDAAILAIARAKLREAQRGVGLLQAFSFALPFADVSLDRVVSSLLLHHLSREGKLRTLREAFRVLRPGGELHVADWGRPANLLMRALFAGVRWVDGRENTEDNVEGRLPELFRQVGFEDARETRRYATLLGTLSLFSARRAA